MIRKNITALYKDSTEKLTIRKDKKGRKIYCPSCTDSFLVQRFKPYEYKGDGFSLWIEDAPAYCCEKCGAVYYPEWFIEKIQMIQEKLGKLS